MIMLTQKKLVLAYPLSDVPELKKVSRGVKGITLDQGDSVLDVAVAGPATESVVLHSKTYSVKKIRLKRRTGKAGKLNA